MTRRQKIALGAALLVALAALALLLLRRAPAAPAEAPAAPTETGSLPSAAATANDSQQVLALNPVPSREVEQGPPGHLQMAELFAERYGSYSNQEPYANLRDLLPVMTAGYRARAEAQIAAAAGTAPASSYEGVTSVKVSTKQVALDEAAGAATVEVSLQQTRTAGTAASTVAYRVLRLRLLKSSEDWLVDSAAWAD